MDSPQIDYGALMWESYISAGKTLVTHWQFWVFVLGTRLLVLLLRRGDRRSVVRRRARTVHTSSGGTACSHCGKHVSGRVRDYCLARPGRFGGEVYCYEHQREH